MIAPVPTTTVRRCRKRKVAAPRAVKKPTQKQFEANEAARLNKLAYHKKYNIHVDQRELTEQ